MVIAHRGASSYAPENTFAAFDLALRLGARHLELDVQTTVDSHVVVIHDDTVDRTTNGAGPVAGYTLAALQALDAGARFGTAFPGERIPLFEDVLERYRGRAHLHVELKGRSNDLTRRTVGLIRAHGMTADVTVTSFQKVRLEEARACAPEIPAGWLVREITDTVVGDAQVLGLAQLCPRADIVTRDLVDCLHAEGFIVRAWGVANEELMRSMVEAGADGMTVNFPDRLIAFLESRHQTRA
jgi:glycerophosphoryl diester phosphodiesterase